MGLSFDTISGSGSNGAIIHYKPEPETCAMISTKEMYLLDSGGQYRDGTTDVTRTFHFGQPTQDEKHHYTLVLKSHIAVDSGYILDVVARQGMWKEGLDYKHGTGHGVGSFLNVHEGPHGIGFKLVFNDAPLQAGMIVTNGTLLYHLIINRTWLVL
jgi:Xaa-Pro aminopeptidase